MSDEIRAWYERLVEEQKRRVRQARDDGVSQGISQGERKLFLKQLRTRFGRVPTSVRKRVEAADATTVERWAVRILKAQSLSEVFNEPS